MRTLAKTCMIVSAVLFALFTWIPLVNMVMFAVQPLLMLPVAWWFLFHRHLEPDREELMLRLDAIANAIRETQETPSRVLSPRR